ncbi:argininosuccinate lyase [Tulasnella sp. 332]|nr:argininosuccinate lyase [Tulasnella sp. 332]
MSQEPTKQKLWGGRFTGKTDPLMHEFNQSLRYDRRMYAVDIEGSMAYAKALRKSGLLTEEEEAKMLEGLNKVEEEWDNGIPDDEDIHTANERRLSEFIGPLGGKLHTGRSRNDQVATDMRLWLLKEVNDIQQSLIGLIRVMAERADKEKDYLMPGYTHLQSISSVLNPFDGLISCYRMPPPFTVIWNDYDNSCPEYQSCRLDQVHSLETHIVLTVNSSPENWAFSLSPRTACGVWPTETSSRSS